MLKKAFLFPGQGSQYVGMGKKLCENFKIASDIFEEASEALSIDVKKMCFEGEQSELTLTYNAQPAILTTSVAMFKVFMDEVGVKPDIMAGHSLGEISALTCAGAINFSDAVKISRKRGEFMQKEVSPDCGSMVAISTRNVERIKEICQSVSGEGGIVDISNYNSRTQLVISGDKLAVDKVVKILSDDNIKSKPLNVSAPFHSLLMQPAAKLMKQELEKYTFNNLIYPVLSNVTARPYIEKEEINKNLTDQIVMPVRWVDSMVYLKLKMIEYGVEFGPGNVLKNMMKSNISNIKVFAYDNESDAKEVENFIKESYIPFLSRSMGIAASTRNANWNNDEYRNGVIEKYIRINELQQLIEKEGREATMDEMRMAIDMLISIFKTKKTPRDEQISRFRELFADTGTENLFKEFDYSMTV